MENAYLRMMREGIVRVYVAVFSMLFTSSFRQMIKAFIKSILSQTDLEIDDVNPTKVIAEFAKILYLP